MKNECDGEKLNVVPEGNSRSYVLPNGDQILITEEEFNRVVDVIKFLFEVKDCSSDIE